jgi:hypothetical protein
MVTLLGRHRSRSRRTPPSTESNKRTSDRSFPLLAAKAGAEVDAVVAAKVVAVTIAAAASGEAAAKIVAAANAGKQDPEAREI